MSFPRCSVVVSAAFILGCADPGRLIEVPLELAEARPTTGISIIDLGSISADGGSTARDVNASGVIVGHAATKKYEPDSYFHAMRWTVSDGGAVFEDDLMTVLGLPATADALALGVNDAGTVIGQMRDSDQQNYQGFVLSSSGVVDVSVFPRCDGATDGTNYSTVRDINSRGEVVGEKGYIPNPSNLGGYSFYLDLAAASPCLVPLPGLSMPGAAYAINDSSVIVGESFDAPVGWAIQWRRVQGQWTVSKLGRDSTRAWDINLRGDIAGQFAGPNGNVDQHALHWRNTGGALSERELGTLGGPQSVANGVDDTGRVVGWAHNKQWNMRAFDWTSATGMRDLGSLGGKRSSANAINGKRVVGDSELATVGNIIIGHATLWRLP